MNKVKRLLFVLPILTFLFGCKKKTYNDTSKNSDKTTKTVVTTKNNGKTNNTTTTSIKTTKKNNNGKCHYEFVDYDGTVLLQNDVTKGTTISESIIPKPNRANEGEYFYYFTGWDKEVNRTINSDVTYTAQYEKLLIPYTISGNKAYFGYYPQTYVSDESITTSLNTTAKLPQTNDNWISYNYYSDNSKSDYMWYIDLDTNSDGRYDYRGVYFTDYRPYKTTYQNVEGYSRIDDNGYLAETVYWFKYEIIEWDILKTNDGSKLLLANLVLDSQEFYPDHNNIPFKHNGAEGYVNTYKLSEIRKWLNDNFYNTAFNSTEQKIILLSDFSTREYVQTGTKSSSCKDYIYLLSDIELENYISNPSSRTCSATDYAKIQGVSMDSNIALWGLRTPSNASQSSSNTAIQSQYVDFNGYMYNQGTDYTDIGVRPCLLIKA